MEKQSPTGQAFRELKIKARELLEEKGISQKEVAKMIGVSDKTIGKWRKNLGWYRYSQKLSEKKKAKQLIVILGFEQKETALMVGVTERTISQWAIKYEWAKARAEHLQKISDITSFTIGFKQYVLLHYEPFYEGISSLMDNYYQEVFLKQQEGF